MHARVLLVGTWLNIALYTTEVALFVYFMPRWKLHPVYHYGIYFLLLNDAAATFAVCTNLFVTIVDGSPQNWALILLLLSSGISATLEQTFLIVSLSCSFWVGQVLTQYRPAPLLRSVSIYSDVGLVSFTRRSSGPKALS